jgi:hypothetical protein
MARRAVHGLQDKMKRVQPSLCEADRNRLEEVRRCMDASSESEAIRRMVRFCHHVITLVEGDTPSVWVNGQRIIIPF